MGIKRKVLTSSSTHFTRRSLIPFLTTCIILSLLTLRSVPYLLIHLLQCQASMTVISDVKKVASCSLLPISTLKYLYSLQHLFAIFSLPELTSQHMMAYNEHKPRQTETLTVRAPCMIRTRCFQQQGSSV